MSKGLSQARDGERLTSINHGFKLLSSMTSYPKSSKQFVLWIQVFFIALKIWFSPDSILLMIKS